MSRRTRVKHELTYGLIKSTETVRSPLELSRLTDTLTVRCGSRLATGIASAKEALDHIVSGYVGRDGSPSDRPDRFGESPRLVERWAKSSPLQRFCYVGARVSAVYSKGGAMRSKALFRRERIRPWRDAPSRSDGRDARPPYGFGEAAGFAASPGFGGAPPAVAGPPGRSSSGAARMSCSVNDSAMTGEFFA